MRHLADAMLRRVGKVAERHYRELPKHRRNERLSGGRGEQWKVVREAMDRISLIQELLTILIGSFHNQKLNLQFPFWTCLGKCSKNPVMENFSQIFLKDLYVQVFDHHQLQLALLSLPSLLQKQDTVSCVIVLGINMFYHQMRVVTPVSQRAHVAKLVATAEVFF